MMSLAIFLYHNYASGKMSIRKLFGLFNGKSDRPKIAYSSDGRSGHVHYQSSETSFTLYYEFGGGNCVDIGDGVILCTDEGKTKNNNGYGNGAESGPSPGRSGAHNPQLLGDNFGPRGAR